MQMRRFSILTACVCIALWAGPALAQQKVIKIGAVYPLTGNLAATGMDCKRGVDLAVEIINGKFDLNLPFAKEEGIPSWAEPRSRSFTRTPRATPKTDWPRPNG